MHTVRNTSSDRSAECELWPSDFGTVHRRKDRIASWASIASETHVNARGAQYQRALNGRMLLSLSLSFLSTAFARLYKMAPTRKTGFIYHSVFAWIDVGNGALGPTNSSLFIQPTPPVGDPVRASQPRGARAVADSHLYLLLFQNTKRRAFELIEATGLLKQLERVDAVPATREDVELFHTAGYLDQIIKGDQQHSGHDLKDGTTHVSLGLGEAR